MGCLNQWSVVLGARAWALLLVLCGTIFLESAYVLGYAGFTLLGGRAADLLGRRRMFLL